MPTRDYDRGDDLVINIDQALRTLFGRPRTTSRSNPAAMQPEIDMSERERDHTARLMRINHTGEVCAQGLYQGQAVTARDPQIRASMQQSSAEENDHLDWCEQRVTELGGRLSLLNPLWYAGSFAIGAAAGVIGDKWSLGFVAETEKQVEDHLQSHLEQVRPDDHRTRSILEQMKTDEIEHGHKALEYGGNRLPAPIRLGMRLASRVMTRTVYHL